MKNDDVGGPRAVFEMHGGLSWLCIFTLYFYIDFCAYSQQAFKRALLFLAFLCSYFFLVQKCLKLPKFVIFSSLASLARSFEKSDQFNLSRHNEKFIKCFYFNWNSFFGTFILIFPFHGNIVLLF